MTTDRQDAHTVPETAAPSPLEVALKRLRAFAGPRSAHDDAECDPANLEECAALIVLEELERLRSAPNQMLAKSSDRLAAACLRAIDRGALDARSEIGDALLDWCGVRCDTRGDEINAFRRALAGADTGEG